MSKMQKILVDFRLLIVGLVVASSLLAVAGVIDREIVSANHACPHNVGFQLYGRDENCGYFLNSYVDATGSGLLTGIADQFGASALLGVNDVDRFVAVMAHHVQLYNGCNPDGSPNSDQRRNSAAFIILTMQGAPAGTVANGPCVTGYSFARWENLVRQYAARGLINFNENHTYQFNTRIQRSTMDVAWYSQAFDTRLSIVVRAPNGSVIYAIKKDCANPVGIPGALTNLDTPTTISCGNAVTIVGGVYASPEPGESFTLTTSFTTGGGSGPDARYSMWINLPAAGVNNRLAAVFGFVARGGGSGSGTIPNPISPQTVSIPNAGRYSGTYRIEVTDATNSPLTCPFTVDVVSKPYHRVYGGDVSVGGGFEGATSCATDTAAGVTGTNLPNAPYRGAGSQLATFALDMLFDFATGQVRSNATDPDHLSFANINHHVDTGWPAAIYARFGGGMHPSNAVCAKDYYSKLPATAVAVPTNPFVIIPSTQGVYRHTGDLRLTSNPGGVGTGRDVTIYVDGNVFVEGTGITYQNGAYTSIADIPSLRLIVRGNIYLEPSVTQLDGLYVAQPNTSNPNTTGRFVTCGSRAWSGRNPNFVPTDGEMVTTCRTNKLRVHGAVIADVIKLLRTAGTLTRSTTTERATNTLGDAAEVFIFSPEIWLNGDLPKGSGEFDAVVPLPPVL